MLCKLEHRRSDRKSRLTGCHGCEPLALADRVRQVLIEPLFHSRLVVECLHLWRRAKHMQINRALRLRREMRQTRETAHGFFLGCCSRMPSEKRVESE